MANFSECTSGGGRKMAPFELDCKSDAAASLGLILFHQVIIASLLSNSTASKVTLKNEGAIIVHEFDRRHLCLPCSMFDILRFGAIQLTVS